VAQPEFPRSAFKFWVTVPTRFRDLDPMGHVNSSVYFTYFETGRTDYFAATGVSARRVPGKWGIPVVSQTCDYRQQVFHPSTLEIGVRCAELGAKTVQLAYAAYLAGTDTLVAEGRSISVWVDLEIPKSVALPEEIRRALSEFDA
jgi:acyl-CoA thioester hydrolase